MNLIFDIGNVLVKYKPMEYLGSLFQDSLVIENIHETIFKSKEWILMDKGLLSFDEAADIYCKREPNYRSEVQKTMAGIVTMFTPLEDTIKLLPKLKKAPFVVD